MGGGQEAEDALGGVVGQARPARQPQPHHPRRRRVPHRVDRHLRRRRCVRRAEGGSTGKGMVTAGAASIQNGGEGGKREDGFS